MAKKLSGVFAPITTPFVDEEVSYQYLKENMQKYRETPLAGFFAIGSNGENKSLTEDEKLKILEVIVEEKAEHQIVMAGTGYESTRQTVAFSNKVADLGIDCVSILTPSYFKKRLTDEALIRYYTDVADAVSVPVLVYNAPGFAGGMTVSPAVIEKISAHPNIAGMKDSSGGNMSSYLQVCADDFAMLAGTVSTLFMAMLLGGSGGVVSLGDAFPQPCCELFDKLKAGDIEAARTRHYTLYQLNRSVSGSFGVAGVKYAMELGGYHGGDPRLPLLPITDDGKKKIRDAVATAGLISC